MGFFDWLGQNWFTLLQSVGIIGSLLFTAVILREDTKSRRIYNLITITDHHRSIWTQLYERPELARVFDPGVDLSKDSIRREEELFVKLLILNLASVHEATKQGVFVTLDGLRKDIDRFFSFPIPKAVWEKLKPFQNRSFVAFVDGNRSEELA